MTLKPEIAYLGYQKFSFDNENSIRSSIEGLQVKFSNVLILFHDPVIANFGLLRYQNVIYEHKNSSRLIIECLHIAFAKKGQLKPMNMKLHIQGFEVSGTQF